jgi:hypothetical protein
MSGMKHTTGPWLFDKTTGGKLGVWGVDLTPVAWVVNDRLHAEGNGALIAAAPDLLAECQKQVVWLQHIRAQRDVPLSVKLGIEQGIKYLNAAITKSGATHE